MSTNRGFSLAELVVCMALSGLILSAALATLPAVLRQDRACGEAKRLQLLIERARTASLASSLPVTVELRPGEALLRTPGGDEVERLLLRKGLALTTTGNVEGSLTLFPSHTATPATITLQLNGASATVVVSLRGRTRVAC